MSEDAKPRKVLSLKKKVTEEPSQLTVSPPRSILGLNRPRTPASSWSLPASKPFRAPAPPPARPVKVVETKKDVEGKTVRPKTWNKLQQAAKDYPAWVAQIRGQIGEKIPRGFILEQKTIQIFSKKVADSSSN